MTLHDDATATLQRWDAPDAAQEDLRLLYLRHLAAEPDAMMRSCRPDHLTSSALVISPDGEQVVLTKHPKAGLWLQTGGHCEPTDTTLAAAALREALEESGIADLRIDPVPLLLSRHEVPFCGPVQPAHHLDVQFMATAPAHAELVISVESDALRWCPSDRPPDPTDQDVRDLIAAARTRLRGIPGIAPRGETD
ncbi:NUDIX domain-containing protein [Aeromicrobium sp. CF3.5]|uniref:NUDIX domain-containing protein n=1 Tax=Aeromicrobium sp. CF3.5 TaxID=3373078 RepID=UPI003EE47535